MPTTFSRYLPLIVLVSITALAAGAIEGAWMPHFMGLFLVTFSMFKFFDLPGFADGFQKYDLLGKRCRAWALLYPFLELGLGLAYLAQWKPEMTSISTIILMSFGSLGVFNALRKGLCLKCACMGTALNVPLTTVAIIENFGMILMALYMFFSYRI